MTPVDKLNDEYIREEDLAKFLGWDVRTIRNKISLGIFPRKIKGTNLFPMKEVDKYLKSNGEYRVA